MDWLPAFIVVSLATLLFQRFAVLLVSLLSNVGVLSSGVLLSVSEPPSLFFLFKNESAMKQDAFLAFAPSMVPASNNKENTRCLLPVYCLRFCEFSSAALQGDVLLYM